MPGLMSQKLVPGTVIGKIGRPLGDNRAAGSGAATARPG